MSPLVIYHGGCRDGFCAAWCIWRRMPKAEFFPGFFGKDPPDVRGREVYIVDFSYPRPVLEKMAAEASSILILDHHKTAEEALHGLPFAHFDMNRSGAGMTWDHFFDPSTRPWIVSYIEDRDLWRHKLENGPAINAYLGTLRYDFEVWYKASRMPLDEIVRFGEVVEDKIRHYVLEVSKNARRIQFEGHDVPCVNAPQVDISELLMYMSNGEVFSVGWSQRSDGKFMYSLRSKGDFDVSEIAKRYGGGGHKNAAGFISDTLIGG